MGKKLLFSAGLTTILLVMTCGCTTVTTGPKPVGTPTSWTEKLTASVKSGTSKVTAMISPKTTPGADAGAAQPEKKPGPGVYVALAQVNERQGNLEAAELEYQKALKMDSGHLGALVGYARLEDGRNNFDAAVKLYTKAIKKHPDEASIYNDLGLCYHRRGKLPEATKALQRAVELQPARRLYRGNLAAVLVEQGKNDAALAQLIAAHGEAVGHYNLAYLLTQKKDNAAALAHFRRALEKDPTMVPARLWVAHLSPAPPRAPGKVEPLPATQVMMASQPQASVAPPKLPERVAAAPPRPAQPPAKPADAVIRAEIDSQDGRLAAPATGSGNRSELHFLQASNASASEAD